MMLSMNRLPLLLMLPTLGFAQGHLRPPGAVAAAERAFAELSGRWGIRKGASGLSSVVRGSAGRAVRGG